MCLLIVASRVLPDWPLVVAANRDERYVRQAAPLTVLRDAGPRILGGKDLLAGGTWLAVNEHGVIAGLTNKPAPEGRDPAKRSRGEIPLALTAASTATEGVAHFAASSSPSEFNPCWVLAGDRTSLYYLDLTGQDEVRTVELPPGVHVLENKALGEPSAKVDFVRARLGDPKHLSADDLTARLVDLLRDHTVNLHPEDGDGSEETRRASRVSSCCVHTDDYGTRSAMLVRVPADPAAPPEVRASEGPSCRHPLTAASLWA